MSTPSNDSLEPTRLSPSGNSYSHHVPGTNICVQFTINIIRRLVREAAGLAPLSSSSGVLLGTYAADAGKVSITIEDYDSVTPSGFSSASGYADLLRLISLWKTTSTGRMYAVGLLRLGQYRNVSETDSEIARTQFAEHPAVMLAVNNDLPQEVACLLFAWTGTPNATPLTSVLPLPKAVFMSQELTAISDRKPDGRPMLTNQAAPSLAPAMPPTTTGFLKKSARAWLLVLSIVVILALGTVAVRYLWPELKFGSEASAARVTDPSTALSLQAVGSKGEIMITWNHAFPLTILALPASLTITDGGYRRVVPLDSRSFREGKVSYLPSTDDIDVRLEVAGAQNKTFAESVHLLGNGRSTALQQFDRSAKPQWLDSRLPEPPHTRPAPKEFAPPASRKEPDAPAQQGSPSVASVASAASAVKGVPASSQEVSREIAGPVAPSGSTQITELPPARLPTTINDVLPSFKTTPNESVEHARNQKPDEQPLPPSSKSIAISPSVPIYQPSPKISAALRLSFAAMKKEVHILVDINENGTVSRARAVDSQPNSPHLLENAASDAARLWRFRPAKVGDKPVPSTMILVFKFSF